MARPDALAAKPSGATALPGWLRLAHSATLAAARADIVRQAKRGMAGEGEDDAGILADRQVKNILAAAGLQMPSTATAQAYRRDHATMLVEGQTPQAKASTFQHFNRLRSGWKYCEAEAIRSLRREAEKARKSGQFGLMRELTVSAFERAVVFEAMFLSPLGSPARQTWGKKSAALRAAGSGSHPNKSKSKRRAGQFAPSPDQLLALLCNQRRRCNRVEVAATVFACFGVRPAELLTGATITMDGDALCLEVRGAKVDDKRGQAVRHLTIGADRAGSSFIAGALLRREVEEGRGDVRLSPADLAAVRRSMREAQPGLSPYAFRHARASDAKAAFGRLGAAAWLGHRTDRAQSGYGNARSSRGAVRISATRSTRPVRSVKTLPGIRKASPPRSAARIMAAPGQAPALAWKPRRPKC